LVLDSSAIVAIQMREAGFEALLERIEKAPLVAVCSATLLEVIIVLSGRTNCDARPTVATFVRGIRAEIVPFREEHMEVAAAAFLRYGKGRHPAALNYGDCMTYAVASVARMPLLFIGDDFTKTDIVRA